MGAGDSEGKVDSAIGRVKRHVTDVRDLVTIVAGVVLAAAQTVATANWGAVAPYAVAVAIVGAAVVLVYLRSGRGRPPAVLAPPAGAAFRGKALATPRTRVWCFPTCRSRTASRSRTRHVATRESHCRCGSGRCGACTSAALA